MVCGLRASLHPHLQHNQQSSTSLECCLTCTLEGRRAHSDPPYPLPTPPTPPPLLLRLATTIFQTFGIESVSADLVSVLRAELRRDPECFHFPHSDSRAIRYQLNNHNRMQNHFNTVINLNGADCHLFYILICGFTRLDMNDSLAPDMDSIHCGGYRRFKPMHF